MVKETKNKKRSIALGSYVAVFFIVNLLLALGAGYAMKRMSLESSSMNIFVALYFVIFSILSVGHFTRNKRSLKGEHEPVIHTMVLLLRDIGIFTIISSVLLFWNGLHTIYAYDFLILGIFCIYIAHFLWSRKENLARQGILYLYRTQLGVKFIDRFAKKYKSVLKPLQYVVVASGYILMVSMSWLLIKTLYIYLKYPITQYIKAPPITPLLPYFPSLFGLESFFPPLYFTYFILALAIVAVTHEFAHGIYMRFYNYKIKSTGFAFLGPILGAFVEQEEEQFNKSKKFPQLVVLAAGTFANVLMTILFGAVLILFFSAFFMPAGLRFSSYATEALNVSEVDVIGNSSIAEGLLELDVAGSTYYAREGDLQFSIDNDLGVVYGFVDSPAFRAQMVGAITSIDGREIKSYDDLVDALGSLSPGETVTVETAILQPGRETVAETRSYEVTLDDRDGRAFLGIGVSAAERGGALGFLISLYDKVKDPILFYESELGNFGWFIYYLLWWIVVINFFVALFNMLPLGILDGGRFFYLTVWGITGRESWGRNAYRAAGWIILLILLGMMVRWGRGVF